MKRKVFALLSIIMVLALALSACGGAAPEVEPTEVVEEPTAVVEEEPEEEEEREDEEEKPRT